MTALAGDLASRCWLSMNSGNGPIRAPFRASCVFAPRLAGKRGVQLFTATQEPHRVNSSIVGQAPELVCFRLQEPKAWACIKDLGADADQVAALPMGSFVSYNRLSGGTLAGKLF